MNIKSAHILSLGIIVAYFFASKSLLVRTVNIENSLVMWTVQYLFFAISSLLFLFIFSHENFFKFARDLEEFEMKKEKKYLKKFNHHGKLLAVATIGTFGGPIFTALTTRLLLNNFKNKYKFMLIASIPNTIWAVGTAKGAFVLINRFI